MFRTSGPGNGAGFIAILVLVVGTGCARRAVQKPAASSVPGAQPPAAGRVESPVPTPPDERHAAAIDLEPAFFAFDSYALNESARAALDRNVSTLRENPSLLITVEGHCDERGTAEYNLALGEQRARVARDYLIAAGIAHGRVAMISYGKERPLDDRHNERAWAMNRRAHAVPQ